MSDKFFKIEFHHPLNANTLEARLPGSTTFAEILNMLYKNNFLEKKMADYVFIINGRACALNKSLSSYILPETSDVVDVGKNGMLTIMS